MGNIDCTRLCDYSLINVLKYEITSTSFYLTKDGFLHKHKKLELANVIKEPFKNVYLKCDCVTKNAMVVVDIMAYAKKVPAKKSQIEN